MLCCTTEPHLTPHHSTRPHSPRPRPCLQPAPPQDWLLDHSAEGVLEQLGLSGATGWFREVVWVQLPLEVLPRSAGSQAGVLELRATAPLRLLAGKARLRVELLEVRLGIGCQRCAAASSCQPVRVLVDRASRHVESVLLV